MVVKSPPLSSFADLFTNAARKSRKGYIMAFDRSAAPSGRSRQRIAVIGSGAAGLSAAWLLSRTEDVTVFEADERVGGHSNTVDVQDGNGTIPIDTGFIVFNEENYPNFTAWLQHLEVAVEDSCMSFGVSIDDGAIEYSGQSLSSVFARRRSALSVAHWSMMIEIVRFHREAKKSLEDKSCAALSLQDFLTKKNFGPDFTARFLKPMVAAIWSSPSANVLDFPADDFFRFFDNHGLLQVLNMPMWRTVSGGSREYVARVCAQLTRPVLTNTAVKRVVSEENAIRLFGENGEIGVFDKVVIATHADTALSLLEAPTDREEKLLSVFGYQSNQAVLHSDVSLMPKRKRAWSSWNYLQSKKGESVSYWMNRLQNLKSQRDFFVTLNPSEEIREDQAITEFSYDHPVFTLDVARAQKELWSLQGKHGVWFCGAHFGQGFHEDAVQSGFAVAEDISGAKRPWMVQNENGRIWRRDSSEIEKA